MSKSSNKYWPVSRLKSRGWSNEQIRALLPKPRYIRSEEFPNGLRVWPKDVVMKAEREEEIMADVNGYTVVAEQGSTGEGKLQGTIEDDDTVEVSAQEYFSGCTYIPVGSMANALLEVKSGTADIALVDSVCALGMVRPDSDYADLVVNMDNNFGDQFYGIAFRKGSDFTAMVNESIAKLKEDGTVAELAEKYGLTDALIQ